MNITSIVNSARNNELEGLRFEIEEDDLNILHTFYTLYEKLYAIHRTKEFEKRIKDHLIKIRNKKVNVVTIDRSEFLTSLLKSVRN